MPIGNITQTMSTISPPPHRGVDVQTVFVNKQEDFQDHLADITIDELNTLKDQLNTRIGEINSTTTTINGYADTASAGASTATTKAEEASTSATASLNSRNQASTFATNSSNSATKASQWADNNYNVEVETGKYSAKHWSTVAQNATANKVDKVTSTDNAIVRFNGTTGDVQNSSVIIDDSGNVGIGMPSTGYKLDVLGAVNIGTTSSSSFTVDLGKTGVGTYRAAYLLGNGTDFTILNQQNGALILGTNNGERMRIDTSGNVLVTGSGGLGYGTGSGGTVTQLTSKSTAVTLNKPSGRIVTHNTSLAAGATVVFQVDNSLILTTDTINVILVDNANYDVRHGWNTNGAFTLKITNTTGSPLSEVVHIHFIIIKGAIS